MNGRIRERSLTSKISILMYISDLSPVVKTGKPIQNIDALMHQNGVSVIYTRRI